MCNLGSDMKNQFYKINSTVSKNEDFIKYKVYEASIQIILLQNRAQTSQFNYPRGWSMYNTYASLCQENGLISTL